MVTKCELEGLQVRKEEIRIAERRRQNVFFGMSAAFFTTQFAVSYYCIFVVPWLGWDLVEPLTYSISQGSFIGGIFYCMRNRGFNTEYSSMEDKLKVKFAERWKTKYNFDIQRYNFLEEKIVKIEQELQSALN